MVGEFEEFLIVIAGPYIFTGLTLLLGMSILAVMIWLLWYAVSLFRSRRL